MTLFNRVPIPAYRFHRRSLAVLLVLFALPAYAWAQGLLTLVDIDDSGFPVMSGKLYASDASGALLHNLDAGDVTIHENGITRQVLSVSCPAPVPPVPLSSVLMIDVSGSMSGGNIQIARSAARAWIQALPLGNSECAVASFDNKNYLNQDFTTDRERLLNAVGLLKPQGGTNYNAGLIDPPAGAMRIASHGQHKRVVIFLTDGVGDGTEDEIVAQALADNVTIYCITIGLVAPPILKNVAARTGGLCFDQVVSVERAEQIYRTILAIAQGGGPCTITWRSDFLCDPLRKIDMDIPQHALHGTFFFSNTRLAAATLDFNPVNASFGGVTNGSYKDIPIVITARGGPARVDEITTGDAHYTIIARSAPPGTVLQAGESVTVTVRYTPTDSSFVFAQLQVISSACTLSTPLLSSGFPGKPRPALAVVDPNGGEELPVGSATTIRWSGTLPDEEVRLEYSTNSGSSWNLIEQKATGLQYPWNVPATPSRKCLLRVGQAAPTGEPLVLNGHTGVISTIAFSPDGLKVATCANDGMVIIWDAYTGVAIRTIRPGLEPGGRPGAVRTVEFSRDGLTLLTAGADGIARIYNLATGIATAQIPLPAGAATNTGAIAGFSPDGMRIAVGYTNGMLCLFDMAGLNQIFNIQAHPSPIIGLGFSPDNRYVSTGGGTDGSVAVWDRIGGDLVKRFAQAPDFARCGLWTPDGTSFVVCSNNLTSYKWPSGDFDRQITTQVYDAAFSPDGALLVVGNWPASAARLDVYNFSTGKVEYSFTHDATGGVYVVGFSSDGHRVASAGIHNDVKIWDFDPGAARQDVSDSLWAIVQPVTDSRDLDLGRVIVGEQKDSLVTAYICNSGDGPLTVSTILFEGADAAEFSVVSGDAPFVLSAGACRTVELRFAPTAIGARSAVVGLVTPFDTMRHAIRGEGIPPVLEAAVQVIDFGGVRLGEKRDMVVAAVVRNVGAAPVTIQRTELPGPDTDQFFLLDGGGSFTLAPGESRRMELRFMPLRTGRAFSRLVFVFDGPGGQLETALFGEGLCPAAGASHDVSMGAGLVEAAPGDTITIPLLIRNAADMPPVEGAFTMGVRFNRMLLNPLDGALLWTVVDGDTLFRYRGIWSGHTDTLALFRFIVALGNAEQTDVAIESFRWEWSCAVEVNRTVSQVAVRVCREGERPRLFFDSPDLALKPIRPNPSRGAAELEIVTGIDGPLRIHMVDALGARVGTLFDEVVPAGMHLVPLDLAGLPAGYYVYVVESGPARKSGVLELVR